MKVDWAKLRSGFDIISYFQDRGIKYWGEGDNVGEGWIGITCLFCQDHANHLGISLGDKNYVCWLCGAKGGPLDLIKEIDDCNGFEAKRVLDEYQLSPLVPKPTTTPRQNTPKSQRSALVTGDHGERITLGMVPKAVTRFFERRRFSITHCNKYNLHYCAHGRYKLRIIAPVSVDKIALSFQAIDTTGRAKIKYLDCPKEIAVVHNKDLLYGLDDVRDQIVLVEGILDKWRIGDNGVALMGKRMSVAQKSLLMKYTMGRKIKVLLDADAQKEAFEIAGELLGVLPDVSVIPLDKGDPADLDESSVRQILYL